MCCTWLSENTGQKLSKNRHLDTIAQICLAMSSQLRHVSTIGKKILNSNISSTCPHNTTNFGPLGAEICWRVWGTPANFNRFRILASLLQRRPSTEANQTLHDLWLSPGLVHYIYVFGGSCPLTECCQLQNSLCVQVLRSPILAVWLHGTRPVGVSQTLWRGTGNGITELSHRAPAIFGWAAIAFGIDSHSSAVGNMFSTDINVDIKATRTCPQPWTHGVLCSLTSLKTWNTNSVPNSGTASDVRGKLVLTIV